MKLRLEKLFGASHRRQSGGLGLVRVCEMGAL